jgi:hypothetical protein
MQQNKKLENVYTVYKFWNFCPGVTLDFLSYKIKV